MPKETRTSSKFTEVGASGLAVSGGRVSDEFLPPLKGDKANRVWREMGDNDAYSGALLYGLMQTVLRVDWTIDLNGAPVKEGEFLEQCQDDMEHPFRDLVAEAMSCAQYGWAWLEVVHKLRNGPDAPVPSDFDDGRIGWRKMPLRSQDTLAGWELDPDEGSVLGMKQRLHGSDANARPNSVVIDRERSLHFRTTHHKNNPEGRSVLRSGYLSWNKRKQIEIIEGIGVERDFAGLPVFYVPAEMLTDDAPADQKAAVEEFKKMGRNLRNDQQAFVMMPQEYDPETNQPLYKFELASTNGRRMFDTTGIINRLASAQLMSIMADVMMLGHESVGSLALSRTKQELFTSGIQSLVDEIRNEVNHQAVPRLFRLNGIKDPFPRFTTSPVERVDPGDFVQMILQYSQSGAPLWPDDELDDYVRDYLGLPARTEDGAGMGVPKVEPPVREGGSPKAADPKAEQEKQGTDTAGKRTTDSDASPAS